MHRWPAQHRTRFGDQAGVSACVLAAGKRGDPPDRPFPLSWPCSLLILAHLRRMMAQGTQRCCHWRRSAASTDHPPQRHLAGLQTLLSRSRIHPHVDRRQRARLFGGVLRAAGVDDAPCQLGRSVGERTSGARGAVASSRGDSPFFAGYLAERRVLIAGTSSPLQLPEHGTCCLCCLGFAVGDGGDLGSSPLFFSPCSS